MNTDYNKCIDCGRCTRKCVFLNKYKINLKQYAQREDLAYSCFLCGDCKRVCPVDIDGRQISLGLRNQMILNDYDYKKEGYNSLVLEKKDYIFKNYRNASSKTVLFPGCNFPSYYPKTTKLLSKILWERENISTVFDCCGKPISEMGIQDGAQQIIKNINHRFLKHGIEEIIVLCPNCYYFLKNKVNVKVSTIYEKLREMDLLKQDFSLEEGALFMPCPDKDTKEIFETFAGRNSLNFIEIIEDIQCCGAGGIAGVKEPELSAGFRNDFKKYESKKIYTYCGTCSGMIVKTCENVEHVLCTMLNTDEKPAKGIMSLLNRASFKVITK